MNLFLILIKNDRNLKSLQIKRDDEESDVLAAHKKHYSGKISEFFKSVSIFNLSELELFINYFFQ